MIPALLAKSVSAKSGAHPSIQILPSESCRAWYIALRLLVNAARGDAAIEGRVHERRPWHHDWPPLAQPRREKLLAAH